MESELSAKEICSILKASQEAGVTVLKFRGLYVRFGWPASPEQTLAPTAPESVQASTETPEEISQQAIDKEAILTKEERLALMVIEEPEEYERLMFMRDEFEPERKGEITDDDGTL